MKSALSPILVPVDFSPDSSAALSWASRMAERTGSALVVLHVVHDPAHEPGTYRHTTADGHLEEHESVAREALEAFVASARAADAETDAIASAELVIVSGLPARRILEIAEARDAHHLVMGSRGLTGFKHLMLGSTAERVIQLAHVPVTIVKRDRDES